MNFPFYRQFDMMDCGPTCLRIIAKYYGKTCSLQLLREKCQLQRTGVSLLGISKAAEDIGFRSVAVFMNYKGLMEKAFLPCIAHWNQNHFVVVYKINKKYIWIADPGKGKIKLTKENFESNWISKNTSLETNGIVLLLEPTEAFFAIKNDETDPGTGFFKVIKRFYKYRRLLLQVFLGTMLGVLLQVILPFLSQSVVDTGIANRDISFISLVLIGQIVVLLSTLIIDFIKSWVLLFIGSRVNIDLLTDFFVKLMKLPMSFFDIKNTGDVIQRMSDHSRLQSFVTNTMVNVLFTIINLIVFISLTLTYDFRLFIIFLTGSILYIFWIAFFFRVRKKIDYIQFDLSAKNQNSVLEIIQGMQDIKLNNSERQKRWDWEILQVKIFKLKNRSLFINQLQTSGASFINQSKNFVINFWVAKEVINGNISIGSMIAVQYIIGQLNGPLIELVQLFQSYQDAKISFDRIEEIHQQQEEEPVEQVFVSELPKNPSISIKDISFKYPGIDNEYVLRNINFQILHGKTTAIVGASGSGKTTFLKLILQFYQTFEGEIFVDNIKLNRISPSFWRSNCGVVTQDGFIFSDTIQGNIVIGDMDPDPIRLDKALEVSNLKDFVDHLPLRLNTKIGPQGIGLSQGQKQRLLIARAIYKNPEYILFDEATNALDAKNELIIMNNLKEYLSNKTAIFVAHRLSTVKHADQIVVFDKGVIVEIGSHLQLINQKGHYYELIKNQLELGN